MIIAWCSEWYCIQHNCDGPPIIDEHASPRFAAHLIARTNKIQNWRPIDFLNKQLFNDETNTDEYGQMVVEEKIFPSSYNAIDNS